MNKIKLKKAKPDLVFGYILAFVIGLFVGFRLVPEFVAVPYLGLCIICLYFAFQNNYANVLSLLPYLIYTEMFVRTYIPGIPYLFMPYFLIALFTILIIKNGVAVKLHSKSFILMLLFVFIEFINISRSNNPDVARGLVTNSFVLVIVSLWSSYNIILPPVANRILSNVKYASIYLCGIVLARYLMGGIEFSAHSGSEGTNGLAPVQISGYLGFSCAVFFFSIMNDTNKKHLLINLVLIFITAVVMILSFSRGGIYFLGVIMILYFLFNRTQLKNYFLFFLLVPVGLLVFYYVSTATNGLIEERYEQKGSSGRDELVEAGWNLFTSEPLAGVGTANFNSEIKKRNLYSVESGAHNEFIRIAAEHGILGLITYWGYFIFLFIEILGRKKIQREYAIYFLVLFCLICVHNGLKISLQPLLIVLAVATPTVIKIKKKKYVLPKQELAFKP